MIPLLLFAALVQGADYSLKADSRAIFRPLDDVGTIQAHVDHACRDVTVSGGSLAHLEGQASEQLSKMPRSADWDRVAVALSCARANGFARHQIAPGGYLMPTGSTLGDGAIVLADSVLAHEPNNLVAARLLAILGPAMAKVDSIVVMPGRLTQERGEPPGPPANLLYRAVRAGVHDSGVFRGCVSLLLAAADYLTARDCSRRALAAGADSSWHLLRLAYIAFHTADTLAGTQLFREAIAVASDSASRAEVGWHLNTRTRRVGFFMGRVTPVSVLPLLSDSSARAWIALSDSTERASWLRNRFTEMQRDSHQPLGELLRRHFYVVTYAQGAFWGCAKGRPYLEGVATLSGQMLWRRGPVSPLPPCFATYAPDVNPIKVTAERYRLWAPSTGHPFTLVSYAMALSSMVPSDDSSGSALHYTLEYRERDAATQQWRDSSAQIRQPIAAYPSGFLQGLIVLPRERDASDWAFTVNQDLTRRGIIDESEPGLSEGTLELSDVVIGDPTQHQSWILGNDSLALAPLGAVDRHSTLQLFVQMRAAHDMPQLRTTLRVSRVRDGKVDAKPVMQIASAGAARQGISAIRRELDVNRLGSGLFQLQVEVADGDTRVSQVRMLEVH